MSAQATGHRLILEFDGGGMNAKLICPPDGSCKGGISCGLCGRDLNDPESTPCYDCKDSNPDECWIKTWFDNESPEDLLHGEVEVAIDCEWDEDHLVANITADPNDTERVTLEQHARVMEAMAASERRYDRTYAEREHWKARAKAAREALALIASCDAVVDGDVVSIARSALESGDHPA